MPAYISHAIMGEQIYEYSKEDNTFKIPIFCEELRGYSLGADLASLSKGTTKDTHNFKTKEFFLNMVDYIKDNKLIENSSVMALLYGHIAHYFLDINTHPFIYFIECGCKKVGIFPKHHLVEGYLSSYLSQKILGKNIMEIKPDYFNQINLSDPNISQLLNSIYGKVYNNYKIIKSYKCIILIFSILETSIKSGFITQEMLVIISSFTKFLETNQLTIDDLTNKNHNTFTNPVTGEEYNKSFMEQYDKAIEMTLDAIKKVNNCLYSNSYLSSLDKVFEDLSYDTGVPCSKGKKLIYVRKTLF